MENGRLYHCQNGEIPEGARTDRRLPTKDRALRERRIAEHLATDYSQSPVAVKLRLKQVTPVVMDDWLCVDTEEGIFTLDEIMGIGNAIPSSEEVRIGLEEIHASRKFPEDVNPPIDMGRTVVVTLKQGTSRRGDDT